MKMFRAQRWCFTTCTLFFLCPRRSYTGADNIRSDFKILSLQDNHVSKLFPAKWAINIVKEKTSATSRLEDTEPGFDFSEEEMSKLKLWRGGVIPYYIDDFSFDKVFRDRIRTFLDVTSGITGLKFLELHTPPDDETSRWVLFLNRQGLLACADHPFKNFTNQGVQKIVLGYDCLTTGGELAEVVLALVGIPPQHNAPDRNKYIHVIKANIIPGKAHLFESVKDDEWLFHDVDYDFFSASHYPFHKYTVNGMATIQPVHHVYGTVGEGNGFSYTDIWKIRMLYNYISKKQQKSMSFPNCDKLFNINSNFSTFKSDSEDEIEPRKKPNKYLGLPDDILEPSNSSSVSEKLVNKTKMSPSDSEEPQSINEQNFDQDAEELDEEYTEEPDNSEEKPINTNFDKNGDQENRKNLSRIYSNMDEGALFILSDYQTEDEYNKKKKNKKDLPKSTGKKYLFGRFK